MPEKIIKIPPGRWEKDLKEIFNKTFDSDLPHPDSADIYGTYNAAGRIQTFILVEKILLVGQIYSAPGENDRHSVKKLVDYIVNTLPDKVVGAVASEKRFEGLFRLLGMTRIDGTFFRRNL